MQCPICGSEKYKKTNDNYICEGCSVCFDDPDKFLVEKEGEEEPRYRPKPFSNRLLYGVGLPNNLY